MKPLYKDTSTNTMPRPLNNLDILQFKVIPPSEEKQQQNENADEMVEAKKNIFYVNADGMLVTRDETVFTMSASILKEIIDTEDDDD